jgi:transposase
MSKTAIEVITSVQRRRRWSAAEKERLVAASLVPGTGVSAVAREAGISPSQLYGWRRQLCARPEAAAAFAAVRIAAEPGPIGVPVAGTIDIEFASGARMRIAGAVEPATLMAAVAALASGGRRR